MVRAASACGFIRLLLETYTHCGFLRRSMIFFSACTGVFVALWHRLSNTYCIEWGLLYNERKLDELKRALMVEGGMTIRLCMRPLYVSALGMVCLRWYSCVL